MQIHVGFEMIYDCPQPTPMIFTSTSTSPACPISSGVTTWWSTRQSRGQPFVTASATECTRIVAPEGRTRVWADAFVNDTGVPDAIVPQAQQIPVPDLPEETLVFLLGSRYCETDRLSEAAWNLFGQTPPGWGRVQAICDYVHRHLTFGYEHARMTRTALEAFHDRTGVCRDFTHLAVAFCRCMNIPARYCTGYLGDIGVPPVDAPMDFSAWFEVFLGGQWHTFDARHNTPRIGRVLIARGRDAADVALSNTFGPNTLTSFRVWTDEVPTG
jgi:transglutaminase-like putative cysteine protease